MNKPAGKKKGFSLGSTAQSHTKGICTWCLPHPKKPNHTVVLLDTEGLGDVEKVISFWLKTRNSVNITWIEEESFDTGYVRSWMNLHNGAPCEELPQMVSRVRGLLRETRETVDPRTPIPSESGPLWIPARLVKPYHDPTTAVAPASNTNPETEKEE
ncbi:guanylate-binding protein 7-like isoform 3-T3 [Trichechus inunguis]